MTWIARVARASVVGLAVAASAASAQMDLAKALVGKWEGEVQAAGTQKDAQVTLVIESVSQQDGKWVGSGRYGLTGKGLPRVPIEIDVTGAKPTLKFTGPTHAEIRLSLLDERHLSGTFTPPGSGVGRGLTRPMKLEKVP